MITRVALIMKMNQVLFIHPYVLDVYETATRFVMFYPAYKDRYDGLMIKLVGYMEHVNKCRALLAIGGLGQETTNVYYQVFSDVLDSYHGLIEFNNELTKVRALNKLI